MAADLGNGLAHREAFIADAAGQVIEHLVNRDSLKHASLNAEGAQAGVPVPLGHGSVPETGKIVFVYRSVKISAVG